jgi:hypothetical protein
MNLHPATGQLLNPFHAGQVYDRTPVNTDDRRIAIPVSD